MKTTGSLFSGTANGSEREDLTFYHMKRSVVSTERGEEEKEELDCSFGTPK